MPRYLVPVYPSSFSDTLAENYWLMLFANHLHQHALGPAAVEFAVEDLFPGAEIELALGDRDDDLAAHDLAFHVGIGIVFARAVVLVALGRRIERGQSLEPLL